MARLLSNHPTVLPVLVCPSYQHQWLACPPTLHTSTSGHQWVTVLVLVGTSTSALQPFIADLPDRYQWAPFTCFLLVSPLILSDQMNAKGLKKPVPRASLHCGPGSPQLCFHSSSLSLHIFPSQPAVAQFKHFLECRVWPWLSFSSCCCCSCSKQILRKHCCRQRTKLTKHV